MKTKASLTQTDRPWDFIITRHKISGAAYAVGNVDQQPEYEPCPLGTQFPRGVAILQAFGPISAGTKLY
jgi:hypothetical protein